MCGGALLVAIDNAVGYDYSALIKFDEKTQQHENLRRNLIASDLNLKFTNKFLAKFTLTAKFTLQSS